MDALRQIMMLCDKCAWIRKKVYLMLLYSKVLPHRTQGGCNLFITRKELAVAPDDYVGKEVTTVSDQTLCKFLIVLKTFLPKMVLLFLHTFHTNYEIEIQILATILWHVSGNHYNRQHKSTTA